MMSYMDDLTTIDLLRRQARERVASIAGQLEVAQQELAAIDVVERLMKQRTVQPVSDQIAPKLYTKMTQDQAIQDFLERSEGQYRTAAEVTEALQRGAFPFTGKDPQGSVYQN